MSEPAVRTSICSVIFVDIVDYSKAAVDRQVTMKQTLNAAIREGLMNTMEDELIVLDAGDGAAICFFGDPEDALFSATAISGALRGTLRLRTGINLGPVKIVTDLNGNRNVIGDAINVAQRVMSFADESEVLISRSYYEVVSCLRDENAFRFMPLGMRKDKHIREHEVYAVASADELARGLDSSIEPEPQPDIAVPTATLEPAFVETCSAQLAQILGPLAGMIVKKAAAEATSREAFVEALASKIDSPAERRGFREALGERPVASVPDVLDMPVEEGHPPVSESDDGEQPLDEAFVERATAVLMRSIGPIAAPIAKRAAKGASSAPAFLDTLAGHIEDAATRKLFIEAMRG